MSYQDLGSGFRINGLMGFGMDIVGVVDERAGNQLPKLKPAAAAWNGQQILGKPPACIEKGRP